MGKRNGMRKVRHVRLTEPLVRDTGQLRSASWDEALNRAAAGFARHRGGFFGMFSCSKATNEVNYTAQRFTRAAMGSNKASPTATSALRAGLLPACPEPSQRVNRLTVSREVRRVSLNHDRHQVGGGVVTVASSGMGFEKEGVRHGRTR
jgi:formate dehydrogenase major subunit